MKSIDVNYTYIYVYSLPECILSKSNSPFATSPRVCWIRGSIRSMSASFTPLTVNLRLGSLTW